MNMLYLGYLKKMCQNYENAEEVSYHNVALLKTPVSLWRCLCQFILDHLDMISACLNHRRTASIRRHLIKS